MQLKKQDINFKRILIGLIIYSIGNFFYIENRTICAVLTVFAIISIIRGLRTNLYYLPFKGSIKTIYLLFIFWNIITIIRGFFSVYDNHSLNPIYQYGIVSYLLPLIVFIGTKNMPLKDIVKFSIINAVLGIVSVIVYYKEIFGVSVILLDGEEYQLYINTINPVIGLLFNTVFVFLIFYLLNKKHKYIAFGSVGLLLFILIFSGRRGSLLMTSISAIFAIYLFLFKYNKRGNTKILKWFFTIIVLASVFLYVYFTSNFLFSFLMERGVEDSRSTVEYEFFKSFKNDYVDWIFGRGISGTYYTTVFDGYSQRGIIESGYLHIILKGGLISLGLFLILLINSFIKGFFKSNNVIIKAMALYILIHILYLYPFGIPTFTLEYLFLWCSVAYCQSDYWRNLNNFQIRTKTGLI